MKERQDPKTFELMRMLPLLRQHHLSTGAIVPHDRVVGTEGFQ